MVFEDFQHLDLGGLLRAAITGRAEAYKVAMQSAESLKEMTVATAAVDGAVAEDFLRSILDAKAHKEGVNG